MTAFPPGISAQGQGALWYLPAVAGANGPTVAEITAGIELSCAIDGFNPSSSQNKIKKVRYCTITAYEIPGKVETTIAATKFVYDPQNPTSTTYPWFVTMKLNVTGFLMNRLGVAFDTAPAAGQFVNLYPIICGQQNPVGIDPNGEGDELVYSQEFSISGPVRYGKAILA